MGWGTAFEKLIDLGRYTAKWRTQRIVIKEPHIRRPDLVDSYDPDLTLDSPDVDLPFEFGLSFHFENKSMNSVDDCSYAVVVEHTESGPSSDKVTTNFPGQLEDYDGLTEPQLSPVIIRTDLNEQIRFLGDGPNPEDSGRIRIDDDIRARIKVTGKGVRADSCELSIHRLFEDWLSDHSGFDMRMFVDDPSKFDIGLEEMPEMVIGEDVGTNIIT
ncbi:hypothetical protein [Natronorubrum sp. DTA7]|uniref:hypothetical protein n=1 Tax=Natronorubrum sp. DTA7 TaxID=3447016 RepID=UPI003F84AFB6